MFGNEALASPAVEKALFTSNPVITFTRPIHSHAMLPLSILVYVTVALAISLSIRHMLQPTDR